MDNLLPVNDRDNWINMQSIFDGGDNPHKRLGSGSTEVVKKLSFQLGCQSQDDDIQMTKNVLTEHIHHRQNKSITSTSNTAVAVPIDVTDNLTPTDRSEINSDIVHVTPLPRHQYNKNHLVLNSPADKEKEDVERENELIYDSLRSKRRYQLWRGNNVFLCYGRLMLGVHIGHLTLSISLITGTWVVFIIIIAPFTQQSQAHCTLTATFFFLLNLTLLIATATTEPGIIPSKKLPGLSPVPVRKTASPQNQICSSCNITKPKRAKHCRHCNNCVEVFDHHCPWTGTCIGIRNYGHFICFVASVVVGAFYVLSTSIFVLIGWVSGLRSNSPCLRCVAVIIGLCWSLLLILLVGMLFMFHIFLIIRGQTTSEFLRATPLPLSTGSIFSSNCCPRKQTKLLPMWQYFSYDDFSEELL